MAKVTIDHLRDVRLCPDCHAMTEVTETRLHGMRRRRCLACHQTFVTVEIDREAYLQFLQDKEDVTNALKTLQGIVNRILPPFPPRWEDYKPKEED